MQQKWNNNIYFLTLNLKKILYRDRYLGYFVNLFVQESIKKNIFSTWINGKVWRYSLLNGTPIWYNIVRFFEYFIPRRRKSISFKSSQPTYYTHTQCYWKMNYGYMLYWKSVLSLENIINIFDRVLLYSGKCLWQVFYTDDLWRCAAWYTHLYDSQNS